MTFDNVPILRLMFAHFLLANCIQDSHSLACVNTAHCGILIWLKQNMLIEVCDATPKID